MAATIYKSPYPDIPLYEGSLVDFLSQSPYRTGRESQPLFVDAGTGRTVTIAEHYRIVRSLTALLKQKGLQRGDVVALFVPNHIFLPALHHAILARGGVISPINSAYTSKDVGDQIESAGAKYAVAWEGAMLKTVRETVAGNKPIAHCQVIAFEGLMSEAAQSHDGDGPAGDALPLIKPAKDTLAYLCFSSGTTGKFKGVRTSHRNMTSNVLQTVSADPVIFTKDAVYVGFLPMTHIYALNLIIHSIAYLGATCVIMPAFTFEGFLRAVVRYKISHVFLVPPVMVLLAKSPVVEQYPEVYDNLKLLYSGAAPLSLSLANAVTARLKNRVKVCQGYGMTETSPVTHISRHDRPDSKVGSVGFLVASCEARLVDEATGQDVPRHGTGELLVRGPNVMMGYLNNEKADAETLLRDGWLRTGDVAHVDEEGFYYIVDRSKEMIKSKGFQVAPAELEALLLSHPHVIDAAVTGHWSEEEATEHPRAYVVVAPDGDAGQIKEWLDGQVAKHKRLWGGIVVVDQIPKSPSGKILRRFLRDRKNDVVVGVSKLKAML